MTLDPMTLWATQQAQRYLQEKAVSTPSAFPWMQYSAATAELQRRINDAGAARVAAGLDPAYCKVKPDGKLGPSTCGAARASGVPTPSTCQSFATTCGGELVGAVKKTSTPDPIPAVVKTVTNVVQAPPSPPPSRNWLDILRAQSPAFWLLSLGLGAAAGAGAAYAIHRK